MPNHAVLHSIKLSTVIVLLTPVTLFFLYIVLYISLEWGLGISITYVDDAELFFGGGYSTLDETLNRSAWGISLILSSVINVFLLAYCLYFILTFKNEYVFRKAVLAAILALGALIWYFISFADLGGGIAEILYKHIETTISVVQFRMIINLTAGTGYLSVYFVAVLLSFICFKVRNSSYSDAIQYLRIYKTVFYLMVTYLSATILQLFLQYQWLTTFINNNDNAISSLTKVYPFIMSVFYAGIVVTLFVPTTELLKNLVTASSHQNREAIPEEKIHELFPSQSGVDGLLGNIKSVTLFLAPIITVIFADLIKGL